MGVIGSQTGSQITLKGDEIQKQYDVKANINMVNDYRRVDFSGRGAKRHTALRLGI